MKPNQVLPIVANLAPAVAAAPPILIAGAIILGLIWLFSEKEESESPDHSCASRPEEQATSPKDTSVQPTTQRRRRITREDLAEALAYGARNVTRQDAVSALQGLGFKKTAAYKALSPEGRFGELLQYTMDGLVEWKG